VSRNRIDVVSLVAGLFFLGVALIWGFAGSSFSVTRGWALPALLVGVGGIGLLTVLLDSARRRRVER
jgi:hypothetical protein